MGARSDRWALLLCLALVAFTSLAHLRTPQLEPDDYRYLDQARSLDRLGWVAASTVENRWDHLWWIDTDERVAFFRPTVFLSYLVDAHLWGPRYELGLLIGNVVIYTVCVLLVLLLAQRWLAGGAPVLVMAGLFAAFFCHGEVIWYVAGRTDSLAATAFLGALALHAAGGDRRRYAAVALFAIALLTKELTAVLPLVCFLHDLWVERRQPGPMALVRSERRLWSLYLATGAGVWALRRAALGAGASSDLYPYLVSSPLAPGFAGHLWAQLRAYGESLLLAQPTKPFLQAAELDAFTTSVGGWLCLAALLAAVALLRRQRRFRFFAALLLLTWLPVSAVYVSERYLLLPSVAVAAIAGLAVEQLAARAPAWRMVALAVAALWIAHQAWWLRAKNVTIMAEARLPKLLARDLDRNRAGLAKSDRILLFDLPGDLFQAQFAESMLRVLLERPRLEVEVLSQIEPTAAAGGGLSLRRAGARRLVATRPRGALVADPWPAFPRVPLAPGGCYAGDGFAVEVTRGAAGRLALELSFERPLEEYGILVWQPEGAPNLPPPQRRLRGHLLLATPGGSSQSSAFSPARRRAAPLARPRDASPARSPS